MLTHARTWLRSFPFDQRSLPTNTRAEKKATIAGWGLLGALTAYRALYMGLPPGEWLDLLALWVVVGGLLAYRGWRMPGADFECTDASRGPCLRCAKMPYMVLMMGMSLLLVGRQVFLRQPLHRNPLAAVFVAAALLGDLIKVRSGGGGALRQEYHHHAKGWVFGAALFVVVDVLSFGFDWPRQASMILFFFVLSKVYLRLSRAKAGG
jgi:hypothetical protein